jgi:predicted cupin superfamily sugar epimerase
VTSALSAAEIIARLALEPHPEGGHFRETFRDSRVDANGRSLSTAIFFLLAKGERSHWHRIDAVEIWHWHAGSPLELEIADAGGTRTIRLGPDIAAGELPQGIVPIHAWQAATCTGEWALVGAPSRRDSILRRSNWRRRIGCRVNCREVKCRRAQRGGTCRPLRSCAGTRGHGASTFALRASADERAPLPPYD